ncbi:hypothetical protein [Rhodoblastus sp.]|uniref:hypothetical protein n=1 Tax=Rhodoblastus sp. TaxID=1962975 RepID=UPI0026292CE8|nr:hypothetical protein [Rhodoblastus sp.]
MFRIGSVLENLYVFQSHETAAHHPAACRQKSFDEKLYRSNNEIVAPSFILSGAPFFFFGQDPKVAMAVVAALLALRYPFRETGAAFWQCARKALKLAWPRTRDGLLDRG